METHTTPSQISRQPLLWLIGGLLLLAVYQLARLVTGLQPGDGSELGTVVRFFGVAHPTGYSLYTTLGRLFFHFARDGQLAVALLTRLCWIAAVVMLVYPRNTYKLTVSGAMLRLAWALFAFEWTASMQMAYAEVYAPLFLLLVVAIRWLTNPATALLGAFFAALAISHHWLGLGILPIVVFGYVQWRRIGDNRSLSHLGVYVGTFLLGLTPWLIYGFRGDPSIPASWAAISTWPEVWKHITGNQYLAQSGWSFETVFASDFWLKKFVSSIGLFAILSALLLVFKLRDWRAQGQSVLREAGFWQSVAEFCGLTIFLLLYLGYPIPDRQGYQAGAAVIVLLWGLRGLLFGHEIIEVKKPKLVIPLTILFVIVTGYSFLLQERRTTNQIREQVSLREQFANAVFNRLPAGTMLLAGGDHTTFGLIAAELSRGEGKSVTILDRYVRRSELIRQLDRLPAIQESFDDPRWMLAVGYKGPLGILGDPFSSGHDGEAFRFQLQQQRLSNPDFLKGLDIVPRGVYYQIRRPGEPLLPEIVFPVTIGDSEDPLRLSLYWLQQSWAKSTLSTVQTIGHELIRVHRADLLAEFGVHLRGRGLLSESEWCYRKAMDYYPPGSEKQMQLVHSIANLYRDRGNAALAANNREVALEQFQAALTIEPEHLATLRNVGLLLLTDTKNFEQALPILQKYLARQRDPQIEALLNEGGKMLITLPTPNKAGN
ncbi:MAG: DUF2723 domain-containing protein [bacterium]|nr:DUF2723 domain-containing protein [bacterium]